MINNKAGAGMGEGFEVDLSDIFDSFFGGGGRGGVRRRQQTGPVQGDDLRADLTIQFKEVGGWVGVDLCS